MAIFEPTQAEKDAASYMDWDDSELGKFTKYVGLKLDELREEDADSIRKVSVASCAMMIVGACIDCNAAKLTIRLDGFTHGSKPEGEWVVTVRKVSKPRARKPQDYT